ncbi:amine acid ABC transporter, permease protein, 3-TM region, His/Glu/Gln/Arg/opine family [Hoeflea phototrophica DFL-43]|uniref:Amine acid ABC transporter, permease protein, 3-TM region, His/Glu/Gln/Arg/opine family n=1 Tax=Hoeflea phototrophica (strain DSM 17068 / NCIMB 14078 / DFL-43) TaxID=411684 RepID=A9D9X8_HOEPD|nr:amino acid ABC transporter permease [Hoeflea phototrophica]EDQ33000.1 amine acid ABC transporter, permease protein, 3-TM region, His/Glu/Gln/Arg/opine family [Hoeflea phototrophica DFL-43]
MDANQKTVAYVRSEESPRMAPPVTSSGVAGWLKENLFASTRDTVLTILTFLLLLWMVPPIVDWAFLSAVWTGESREDCIVPGAGACWAFVEAKFGQFIYGRYPVEERWRVDLTGLLLIAGLVPIAIPSLPYKRENALYLLVVFPILGFILLTGQLGLAPVETALWGGLLVTLVVAIVGIVVSFPLGILLALGRRSEMPIVKMFCIIFIEFWRGVPLITVLFMSSVMLPLFLPEGVTFDKLLRALIGVALFSSAYMAEVIRGGLQAIPKGQYEAANAMALTFWQGTRLVIMPQALKLVIPGIVNTFIGLFKDTSLVLIIGLFDLLGIVQQNMNDPNWISPATPATGFVFAALVFFIFCFGMSRYSAYMERRLDTGHKS